MKLVFPALLFLGALGECRYLGVRPARWAPPAPRRPLGGRLRPLSQPPTPRPSLRPAGGRPEPAARRRPGPAHLPGEEPEQGSSEPVPASPELRKATLSHGVPPGPLVPIVP